MSVALYDNLVERWKDFLGTNLWILDDLMHEEGVEEQYDDLVSSFCKEYEYSDRTQNFAFYERWWDTFADEYYQRLECADVKIIHENALPEDWDYGKQFEVTSKGWKELYILEEKEK